MADANDIVDTEVHDKRYACRQYCQDPTLILNGGAFGDQAAASKDRTPDSDTHPSTPATSMTTVA
jgi:hypothetical protein